MSGALDSAIPPALRCPRSQAVRMAPDYAPPYDAWAAWPIAGASHAPIGCFGVQWQGDAAAALASFAAMLALAETGPDAAAHVDLAAGEDAAGYATRMTIAYWPDRDAYTRWAARGDVADWWASSDRETAGHGCFREILLPAVDRLESLFSAADRLEGSAVAMAELSPVPVAEHAYWGGMRDRIAAAQTDPLTADGILSATGTARRRVIGSGNLAVIRSGQDWSDTHGPERAAYLGRIEPVLASGMAYLSGANGKAIGCHANRYLRHVDRDGAPLDKSFGMSFWRSLADLEAWAEHHPTHLGIFGTFLETAAELAFRLDLRLYHEVMVLRVEEQVYEYIGCHAGTGMLGATCSPP